MGDLGFSSLANTILQAPRIGMRQQLVDVEKQRTGIMQAQENRAARDYEEKQKMLDQKFSAYAHPFFLALDKEGQAMARKAMVEGNYLDDPDTGMTTRRRMAPFMQSLAETPGMLKPYFQSAINVNIAKIQSATERREKARMLNDEEGVKKADAEIDALNLKNASMDAKVAQIGVDQEKLRQGREVLAQGDWAADPHSPGWIINKKTGERKFDQKAYNAAIGMERAKRATEAAKNIPTWIKQADAPKAALLFSILEERVPQFKSELNDINKQLKGEQNQPAAKYDRLFQLASSAEMDRRFPGFQQVWNEADSYANELIKRQVMPGVAVNEAKKNVIDPYFDRIRRTQSPAQPVLPPGKFSLTSPGISQEFTNTPLIDLGTPARSAPPAQAPTGAAAPRKTLTREIAQQILKEAGGDARKAREIAEQRGY